MTNSTTVKSKRHITYHNRSTVIKMANKFLVYSQCCPEEVHFVQKASMAPQSTGNPNHNSSVTLGLCKKHT